MDWEGAGRDLLMPEFKGCFMIASRCLIGHKSIRSNTLHLWPPNQLAAPLEDNRTMSAETFKMSLLGFKSIWTFASWGICFSRRCLGRISAQSGPLIPCAEWTSNWKPAKLSKDHTAVKRETPFPARSKRIFLVKRVKSSDSIKASQGACRTICGHKGSRLFCFVQTKPDIFKKSFVRLLKIQLFSQGLWGQDDSFSTPNLGQRREGVPFLSAMSRERERDGHEIIYQRGK